MNRKAVFFDVDGTLFDCTKQNSLSKPVIDAIKTLRKNGHYAFIASGRSFGLMDDSFSNLVFDGYILCNGAHVFLGNELIDTCFFDKDNLKAMLEVFDSNGIQYCLNGAYQAYLKDEYAIVHDMFKIFHTPYTHIKSEYDLDTIQVSKVELGCPNEEAANIVRSYQNDEYFLVEHELCKNFEITPKQVSKAKGILTILDEINVNIEDSYAFGDGLNDIEMMQTVGHSVAMGNAQDIVKQLASDVCESVDEDGVAKHLVRLGLI